MIDRVLSFLSSLTHLPSSSKIFLHRSSHCWPHFIGNIWCGHITGRLTMDQWKRIIDCCFESRSTFSYSSFFFNLKMLVVYIAINLCIWKCVGWPRLSTYTFYTYKNGNIYYLCFSRISSRRLSLVYLIIISVILSGISSSRCGSQNCLFVIFWILWLSINGIYFVTLVYISKARFWSMMFGRIIERKVTIVLKFYFNACQSSKY